MQNTLAINIRSVVSAVASSTGMYKENRVKAQTTTRILVNRCLPDGGNGPLWSTCITSKGRDQGVGTGTMGALAIALDRTPAQTWQALVNVAQSTSMFFQ